MKRSPRVLALLSTLVTLISAGCVALTPAPRSQGQEKVFVCHKGKKTLEVAEPAVDAHLGHGDTLGRCR